MHWGLDNVFLGVMDASRFNLLWNVWCRLLALEFWMLYKKIGRASFTTKPPPLPYNSLVSIPAEPHSSAWTGSKPDDPLNFFNKSFTTLPIFSPPHTSSSNHLAGTFYPCKKRISYGFTMRLVVLKVRIIGYSLFTSLTPENLLKINAILIVFFWLYRRPKTLRWRERFDGGILENRQHVKNFQYLKTWVKMITISLLKQKT